MKRRITILVLVLVAAMAHAQLLPYPVDTVRGTAVYRYTVEKSIGLYRISVNFGVTQEEIVHWNPQLSSRGLRYDEVILIPVKQQPLPQQPVKPSAPQTASVEKPAKPSTPVEMEQAVAVTNIPVHDVASNSVSPAVNAVQMVRVEDEPQMFVSSPSADTSCIRLAFLLPLQASVAKRDASMDRFYDFYAGALLAVNATQKRGQHFQIYTYDIAKNDNLQRTLMRNGQLRGMDAIIGPTYASQITAAAEWAMQDSVLTVIPFSSSVSDIDTNPYLMQFNPSYDMEAQVMAQYLAQKGDSVNCVLIRAQDNDIPKSIRSLHEALISQHVPYTYTTIHDILVDSIESAFKDSVENIIIFNTEKYSNLTTLMSHLLPWVSSKNITLYSRYSWQNEKILMNQIYTSVFASADSIDPAYTEAFDSYFHHTLSSTLPRYDLLGYDLTSQVIEILTTDSMTSYQGLQSAIRYERDTPESGWKNRNIQVIRK